MSLPCNPVNHQPADQQPMNLKETQEALIKAMLVIHKVEHVTTTIELCRLGEWEDHRPALDTILRRLAEAGIRVSPSTSKDLGLPEKPFNPFQANNNYRMWQEENPL